MVDTGVTHHGEDLLNCAKTGLSAGRPVNTIVLN